MIMIELLKQLISIPSYSREEGAVADFLELWMKDHGLDVHRKHNNLWVESQGTREQGSGSRVLLNAHIDTVRPSQSWTRDPHRATQEGDRIYGLGSNDDGGSLVAMLAAFMQLTQSSQHSSLQLHFNSTSTPLQLPFNIILALTAEEEVSGERGIQTLWDEIGPVDYALVGEPTGMRAATSERGLLVLDGVATGVSGHAARNEGVNALYKAMQDIEALRQHRFERVSPTMGEVRLNVTQINAGTAHNVIPDRCEFVVDIRPTEQYTNEEILHDLQQECQSTLTARNLRNRSSATPQDSLLLQVVKDLDIETFSSPTTSNWMRLPAACDAIKIGPGDSARSHHADEYITISEIEGAIEGYINIIRGVEEELKGS